MITGDRRKPPAGIDNATRRQLHDLARRHKARVSIFTRKQPTDWRPNQVCNPDGLLDTHFTDSTAWELIATRLDHGQEVTVIDLDRPRGTKGYVMLIDLGPDVPHLYVKLQLGSGIIFGRSFHYSEYG